MFRSGNGPIGLGPIGTGSNWDRVQLGPGPIGTGSNWDRVQLGPGTTRERRQTSVGGLVILPHPPRPQRSVTCAAAGYA
jgi:hypothetical protein